MQWSNVLSDELLDQSILNSNHNFGATAKIADKKTLRKFKNKFIFDSAWIFFKKQVAF